MIGPILIAILLVRAALGHGREVPCEPNTCKVEAIVARAKEDPYPVAVNMGPHPAPAVELAEAPR